mmetsp:Transcript_9937/g.29219  ORF Transcript_9937/g.29219 Transcript_9937/m.29219 type:complete len:85 (-) Transcript_9937:111-365(-)
MDFAFAAQEDGSCEVSACSESQVFSIADFSTNYCNLHDLYCGTEDGCAMVTTEDLTYTEVNPNPNPNPNPERNPNPNPNPNSRT